MPKAMTQAARGASAFVEFDDQPMSARMAGIGGTEREEWSELVDQLLRIRNLEDDWDGAGTLAPHPAVVDAAIKLAQVLAGGGYPPVDQPADRVIASVNAGICFEWHTPRGYREIEVFSPDEAESRWLPKGADRAEVARLSLNS